jgi:hypothetical protein
MKARVLGSSGKIVNPVPQLMKECDYLIMFKKRRFCCCWFRKIANQCCSWITTSTIGVEIPRLKREVCGMTILPWTRVKVKVKIANEAAAFSFIIPDTKDLRILMPRDILSFASFYCSSDAGPKSDKIRNLPLILARAAASNSTKTNPNRF